MVVDQAPTVSITSPANNTTLISPATIAISATASDADGTVGQVQFYNGATLIGTSTTFPYGVTWNNVAAGTYTITAIATDNLGAKTTSTAVKVLVNQPPTVSITSPANNSTFTSPATITISATASDADGTVGQVQFYNGATLIGTSTTSPYGVTWNNVAAGSYTITAVATDNLVATTTSTAVAISVSVTHPPVVTLTSPANGATYAALATVTVSAYATDAYGTVGKVQFYNGTTLIGTATSFPYIVTWDNVPAGTYTISAVATDNLGATATSTSATVTVVVDRGPTVSITSPSGNASYDGPATVTFGITASATYGTVGQVRFFSNGTLIGISTASPYGFTWDNVSAGTYTVTAIATDGLGVSTASAPVTITVLSTFVTGITPGAIAFGSDVVVPNPVADNLVLKSHHDLTGGNVHVLDPLGVEVLRVDSYSSSINVSQLASGVYFIVWSDGANTVVRQFVKYR